MNDINVVFTGEVIKDNITYYYNYICLNEDEIRIIFDLEFPEDLKDEIIRGILKYFYDEYNYYFDDVTYGNMKLYPLGKLWEEIKI